MGKDVAAPSCLARVHLGVDLGVPAVAVAQERHEPIHELDERSGSLSSFGMMSSPIRIDAHPMMGAGRMKPPEDGVAYFPKGGGVLYSATHPAGILVPESNRGRAAILAPQKGGRRPMHRVFKSELPLCGARCRDGRPCQAKASWDKWHDAPRNGRCRIHGAYRPARGPRKAGTGYPPPRRSGGPNAARNCAFRRTP
jgi:hypothetical protein